MKGLQDTLNIPRDLIIKNHEPVWIRAWSVRAHFWVKDFPQCRHLNGRSPWIYNIDTHENGSELIDNNNRRRSARGLEEEEVLILNKHFEDEKLTFGTLILGCLPCSPVWILLWVFKDDFWENRFKHRLHWKGRSPVCVLMCTSRYGFRQKAASQTWKGLSNRQFTFSSLHPTHRSFTHSASIGLGTRVQFHMDIVAAGWGQDLATDFTCLWFTPRSCGTCCSSSTICSSNILRDLDRVIHLLQLPTARCWHWLLLRLVRHIRHWGFRLQSTGGEEKN